MPRPARKKTWRRKVAPARKKPASFVARLQQNSFDLDDSLKRAHIRATASQIEELNAAKRYIAEKNLPPDFAIKSFERAADAIKNGIRVFISYKFIHHELAKKFRDLIRDYGQRRLARDRDDKPWVFIAEQGIEAGKDYPKQIQDEIDKAHWFFLLLPDVQFDREWPIYEAGYFQRGMTASEQTHLRSSQEHSPSHTIPVSQGLRELPGRPGTAFHSAFL